MAAKLMGALVFALLFTPLFAFGQAKPCDGAPGRRHKNGGGFVADTANVAEKVFVDRNSHVCGSVKILNSGQILNSRISGNGIIRNTGRIINSRIEGYVLIVGNKEAGEVFIKNATIKGPQEWRNESSREEWVRLSGRVTVHGLVEGSNIAVHNGAYLNYHSRVVGKNIEVEEALITSTIPSCTDFKKKSRSKSESFACTQNDLTSPASSVH